MVAAVVVGHLVAVVEERARILEQCCSYFEHQQVAAVHNSCCSCLSLDEFVDS